MVVIAKIGSDLQNECTLDGLKSKHAETCAYFLYIRITYIALSWNFGFVYIQFHIKMAC